MSLYQEAKTWKKAWEAVEDAVTEYGPGEESYLSDNDKQAFQEAINRMKVIEAQCHDQLAENLRDPEG